MMFVGAVVVAVGLLSLPSRVREGLGAACAALVFSGVQKVATGKTRRARLKTSQCAHVGTLEPRVGRQSRLLPPCKLCMFDRQ